MPCTSTKPYDAPGFNPLVCVGKDNGKMSIECFHAVRMPQDDKISIPLFMKGGKPDFPFIIRPDSVTCFQCNIYTLMCRCKITVNFPENRTEAFVMKRTKVRYDRGIGFVFLTGIREDMSRIPIFSVNIRLRRIGRL